jgi:hypothetical protein
MKQIINTRIRARATAVVFHAPKSVTLETFKENFNCFVETRFRKLVFYHVFEAFSAGSTLDGDLKVFYAIIVADIRGVDIAKPANFFMPLLDGHSAVAST